jgi:nucleotide-binding universal stress UspA family protein
MLEIHRVLVPTDFSAHAEPALKYGAGVAEKFGSELLLLHVVQDLSLTVPDAVMPTVPPMPPVEELLAAGRTNLEALVRDRGLTKLNTRLAVSVGDPQGAILDTAAHEKVDLIVLGTHGRTGLRHLLLGSVAEAVIRRAPCAVLTVRVP